MSSDNHGPQAGCKYYTCGAADPQNCPFVKSAKPQAAPECKHEWRQYWLTGLRDAYPDGFYCVHCLARRA